MIKSRLVNFMVIRRGIYSSLLLKERVIAFSLDCEMVSVVLLTGARDQSIQD